MNPFYGSGFNLDTICLQAFVLLVQEATGLRFASRSLQSHNHLLL